VIRGSCLETNGKSDQHQVPEPLAPGSPPGKRGPWVEVHQPIALQESVELAASSFCISLRPGFGVPQWSGLPDPCFIRVSSVAESSGCPSSDRGMTGASAGLARMAGGSDQPRLADSDRFLATDETRIGSCCIRRSRNWDVAEWQVIDCLHSIGHPSPRSQGETWWGLGTRREPPRGIEAARTRSAFNPHRD
jgi:hypothetical protein